MTATVPPDELRVRGSRRAFGLVLAAGAAGLALAAALPSFRHPFPLFAFAAAALLGLAGLFDRRVKLALSPAGIRYARWGPAAVPWRDFSGYRPVTWRGNPYIQLVPRRPDAVRARFSALGRLNNRCARLVGAPSFAVAVTPLEIAAGDLAAHVARHLPERPPA